MIYMANAIIELIGSNKQKKCKQCIKIVDKFPNDFLRVECWQFMVFYRYGHLISTKCYVEYHKYQT